MPTIARHENSQAIFFLDRGMDGFGFEHGGVPSYYASEDGACFLLLNPALAGL
jgi:hypothetical protein